MGYVALILIALLSTCIYMLKCRTSNATKLPPRLTLYSIILNIGEIFRAPHQALAKLSKTTYGPIMSLKLANVTMIFISSPILAKEVLHKNDKILSGRPVPDAVRALNHHEFSVIWLPANEKWRGLRKICSLEMLSLRQLHAKEGLRQEKVQELLNYVQNCSTKSQAVDIGQVAFTTSLNLLSNTLFSIDLASYDSKWACEFKEYVWGASNQVGRPNLSDYFPIFSLIDPQGIRRTAKHYAKKIIAVFEGLGNERLRSSDSTAWVDVLDALLKLHKENASELSVNGITHLLLDLFIAGAETTSSTLEWAMTEVLRNPKVLSKAQVELELVIGKHKQVQESDISNLPYLQAIVKETFRLHPPIPFLVHRAEANVEMSGFTVPKNAQVVVNIYAIGRDSDIWPNPSSFVPERFLELEIDSKGHNFELLPFGAGRRICLGLPLAYRMLHLVLGSLLNSFEWKLEERVKPGDINMEEKFRFTVQKAESLRAIPIKGFRSEMQ